MSELVSISKKLLLDCLGAKPGEKYLVLTDEHKEELAEHLYEAGKELGLTSMLFKIPALSKSGEEPPKAAAEAMKNSDVVICITEHSLTHTRAKKDAAAAGARIATMPGITKEMFLRGAITADYSEVEKLTKKIAEILTLGSSVVIEKDGYRLEMSIEGRKGIESTGRYLEKGQSGNLPSGEAYIAPVEGSADGKILVDGSIVGLGMLKSPILLEIRKGLLFDAQGDGAKEWLEMLGSSNTARNVAEFGIGTNPNAILSGNILEDEKILGTIHVAFGSNNTFGGKVSAGVHMDAVVLEPTVYVDNRLIMDKGRLVI
ncbi:aminopeptidase [Biomaibacter acetigenes]|uniref:Aminopeptidase n=1 Tax=Biomaibacter acetigenes TaxID=2316383 RepID=A0A3G2R2Y6_9FIRM|nr:aminopeptidase [Biomaibacter acetigenes]AYO29742.1 aminopeptidase [Biomaibacter acetigenes]